MDMEREISGRAMTLVEAQKARGGGEYRSFCEGFPALLRRAGLAQTVAFLKGKGGSPHGDVYDHLEAQFRGLQMLGDQESLMATVATPDKCGAAQYRLYSQIAMRVAQWHKRMAQALLEKRK